VQALRAQLDEERAARERLAERVRSLDARLAELGAGAASGVERDALESALAELVVVGSEGTGEATGAGPAPPEAAGVRSSFDDDALLAAGLTAAEVEGLRGRWEQRQLDSLYLTDQALREGWGIRRIRNARVRQRQAFLDEIGSDTYDQILYATGRPNRVVVRDVYAGSAAEAAGLRAGDRILGYAGQAVFEARDLRLRSALGEPGVPVAIELERDGRLETLRIDRGPLGVSTEVESVPPEVR
jgi:membrane-associated protease RseP (regulator of RpoE activity)